MEHRPVTGEGKGMSLSASGFTSLSDSPPSTSLVTSAPVVPIPGGQSLTSEAGTARKARELLDEVDEAEVLLAALGVRQPPSFLLPPQAPATAAGHDKTADQKGKVSAEGAEEVVEGWLGQQQRVVGQASQRLALLAPQIRALAASPHARSPSCYPLIEELKLRTARLSTAFKTVFEKYQFVRSNSDDFKRRLADRERKKQEAEEAKKREEAKAAAAKRATESVDPEKEARRLKNLALFESRLKRAKDAAVESKEKRKSMELTDGLKPKKKDPDEEVAKQVKKPKPKTVPLDASQEFFVSHRLCPKVALIDGFYDMHPTGDSLLPLAQLLQQPVASASPEVIVVDRTHDGALARWVYEADNFCGYMPDVELKVKMLALFVSNVLGGSQHSNGKYKLSTLYEGQKQSLKQQLQCNVIPLGSFMYGLARHRALLFKYLADKFAVGSEIVRSSTITNLYWNIVELDRKRYLVDVLHKPSHLYDEFSLQYYKYTLTTSGAINASTSPSTSSALGSHDSLAQYDIPPPLAACDVVGKNKYYRFVLPQNFSKAQLVKLHKLGSGGFGSVWRCKLGGFTCAVKIIQTADLTSSAKKRVMQEVALLQKLDHKNVVSFLGQEIKEKELHLFMELVPHSLFEIVQRIKQQKRLMFSPEEIITCTSQIARGLMYLHTLPEMVIHRDIKSKNVLVELDENGCIHTAKLCDFGISKVVTDATQADTSIGTSRWMAPEVVEVLEGKRQAYNEKADIWSLGMVMYEMLALNVPFEEINLLDVRGHILRGHALSLPSLGREFQPLVDLLSCCTKFNPADRFSAEQVLLYLLKL